MNSHQIPKSQRVWILAAWILPLLYPQASRLFLEAGQTFTQDIAFGLLMATAAILWGVSGPIASFGILSQPTAGTRSRPALFSAVIAVITPSVYALIGVLMFMINLPHHHNTAWYVFVAAFSLLVWSPVQAPGNRWQNRKKLHRLCAIPVTIFILFHIANAFSGIISLEIQNTLLQSLRRVYQLLPVEALLITSIVLLFISGVLMAIQRLPKGSAKMLIRSISGLYLAAFFLAHLSAIVILGRIFLKVETNYIWASGGEPGLLFSVYYPHLPPYYFLAVVAFFFHFGYAVIPALFPSAEASNMNLASKSVSAARIFIATVIIMALCGYHLFI